MVEFKVAREKKKILEMRLWSYNKELIILQEFEWDQMPKEMALKWSPLWIQIHNLPLKSRTRETGYSIGTIIGEVLEVDVVKTGVQWGKCWESELWWIGMATGWVWAGFFDIQTQLASPPLLPKPGPFNKRVFFLALNSARWVFASPMGPVQTLLGLIHGPIQPNLIKNIYNKK